MTEKFRPNLHFSPRAGWMNDPNGMIRFGDVWHLFFQHDPDSIVHGPMHWGHASSTDLVQWTEQPVALYPTELGTCFSGSAIETDSGDIKLFYTAHSTTTAGKDHQVQCVVHADATLSTFVADPANPVVPNPGFVAFRDPKVIRHEATDRWIMLVTEGQAIGFYGSDDLKRWTHLSSFGESHGRHSPGPWECPDMVPLVAPNGETHWVLIVGLNPGGYAPGSGTQYFVGQFDGVTFTNANPPETELWLDYGRDYYAAQTFFERGGTSAPVAIAWASNWLYARQTQTQAFRGVMSLPRELRLVETPAGLRLAQRIPSTVHAAFTASPAASGTSHRWIALDLADNQVGAICLFGESQPSFRVWRQSSTAAVIETVRPERSDMDGYGHRYRVDLPCEPNRPLNIELYIDLGLVELIAGDGQVTITNLFFPDAPERETRVHITERADDHSVADNLEVQHG